MAVKSERILATMQQSHLICDAGLRITLTARALSWLKARRE
jgi:hypothetical protein